MNIPKQLQNDKFRFIKIKKGKKPLEKNWQIENNYKYNDPVFINYLKSATGYGIVCGYGKLAVIDADEKRIENAVTKGLPKTFVIQSGRGGYHYYYIVDDLENKIILNAIHRDENGNEIDREHLGEIQFTGAQVIGAGSLHTNGKKYKVKIDASIAKISTLQLNSALTDFIEEKEIKWGEGTVTSIKPIADKIKGLKVRGNELQGSHPVHGSEGGMNFTINTEKNLWHCFRCNTGGDALTLVAVMEKIITCDETKNGLTGNNFKKTKKIAKDKYGIEKVEKDKRHYLNLSNPPKNLEEVYERLRKWLYLTDTYRIDLTLAAILSNHAKQSKPLWIFFVGQSGDGKSEVLGALKDYPYSIFIDQITANTLATGKTFKGKKVPDLGEELQGSSHILLFSDLATLKSLNKDEKKEIWGQFRELYDGRINKRTGNDAASMYDDCHVTLLACTTPDIKAEYSIHDQLGTREFAYEIESSSCDDDAKMDKALGHLEQEKTMKKELQETIQAFLDSHEFDKDITMNDELKRWVKKKCKELAIFRATALFETQSSELRGYISKEIPTRLRQQFELLYKALRSLEPDYPDLRYRHIVENIVKATGEPVRQQIYYFFRERVDTEYNIRMLHEQLLIGRKTLKKQCEVLTGMNILERIFRTEHYGANNNLEREVRYYKWRKKGKQKELS